MLALLAIACLVWLFLDWPMPLWTVALLVLTIGVAAAAIVWIWAPHGFGHRMTVAATVAAAVMSLVATVLAVPSGGIGPGPGPEPTASPGTADLFDDFNDGLDLSERWTLSSSDGSDPEASRQIYVEGGKLHLDVGTAGVNAELKAILPTEATIKKLSMKMTLVSHEGSSDGAAYLIISSAQNRENRVWLGPNEERDRALVTIFATKGYATIAKKRTPANNILWRRGVNSKLKQLQIRQVDCNSVLLDRTWSSIRLHTLSQTRV
jgi:hypothetical protein